MENIEVAQAIFNKYYQEWLDDPSRMDNGYNYESSYAHLMQKCLKEIFENSMGEIPKSRNKKKR